MYLQLFHSLYSLLLAPKDSLLPEEANPSPNSEICLGQMLCKQWTGQGAQKPPRFSEPLTRVHRWCQSGRDRGSIRCLPPRRKCACGEGEKGESPHERLLGARQAPEAARLPLLRACGREAAAHSQRVASWTCREIRVRGGGQPGWEGERRGRHPGRMEQSTRLV